MNETDPHVLVHKARILIEIMIDGHIIRVMGKDLKNAILFGIHID